MLVRLCSVLIAVLGLALTTTASGRQLVVGQVASLENVNAAGSQIRVGMQIYFDAVNGAGGVHGAKVKFVSKDRGTKAADSLPKTRALLAESEPVVLAGLMGTGAMKGLVESKVLDEAKIAVVGIRTGAVSLHEPVHPYLFHTRVNYRGEIEKITAQFSTIGVHKLAVFYEKSAFGKEGLELLQQQIKKDPLLKLIHQDSYAKKTVIVADAVRSTMAANPQGVIVIANSAATAEFYKAFRASGGKAQVIALSVADGNAVVSRIGKEHARGLIVTHVVPDPSHAIPLINELQTDVKKFAPEGTAINQAVVEGYLAAKVVVQALRIAGPNPTRRKVRAALDSMKEFDAGGVIIRFSPDSHSGSKYVELAIILASGKLMR